MTPKDEVYIITAQTTVPLSKVVGFDMSTPDEKLSEYFHNWGIRLFTDGLPPISERFKNKDDAFAARDALNLHLTRVERIREHQNWDTLIWDRSAP